MYALNVDVYRHLAIDETIPACASGELCSPLLITFRAGKGHGQSTVGDVFVGTKTGQCSYSADARWH